jgi:4-aminobutyrate aminotransferase
MIAPCAYVQAATGRRRFISFIGSYHGGLSGSMSISGHTAMTHTLPRAGLTLLPYPDPIGARSARTRC